METFSSIVSKAYDEDRYYLSQTEGGDIWTNLEWFFGNLNDYFGLLTSSDYRIDNNDAKKAISSMEYADDYLERIQHYQAGFSEARDAAYRTLRENIGEGSAISESDIASLIKSARVVSMWFKNFIDIDRFRESMVENMKVLLEWGGEKGPEDRMQIDKLYHATTTVSTIEESGFKINAKGKGLGGSTDDMISTTLSKKVAMAIADSLKRMIAIANGTVDCATIIKWSRKAGVWDTMEEWGKGGMSVLAIFLRLSNQLGEQKVLEMIDDGYAPVFPYGMDTPTVDELPSGAIPIQVDMVNNRDLVKSYWVKDKERNDDIVFQIFRRYLAAMDSEGKGYDPLFFGVGLDNFRGMDINDVGVLELDVDMSDPTIKYLSGMYEYRIPPTSIESILRIA